jgi:Raf kinase inhibitor-like YbhB/YbcL family protein
MQIQRRQSIILFCLVVLMCALSIAGEAQTASPNLLIKSAGFDANAPIPAVYTCSGENKSPALAWTGEPAGTRSYALIVEDPDAPGGTFIHWVAYNLPATVTALPMGVPKTPTIAGGGVQGVNGRGEIGYHGPCPPPGPAHHYHFRLYALDATLDLKAGADDATVKSAMAGHVIARGDLVGTFAR